MPLTTRLALESLDERLVPAAAVLNVTTYGAVATAPSGAIVEQEATPLFRHNTAAGSLRSFLSLDANGVEQGYNTGANNVQLDTLSQGTRALTLSQIPLVTQNGVTYREFLLGVNEPNRAQYLSLDELRLYTASTGNLTGYNATTKKLGGQSPVFDLDSGGDVSVKLNARLDRGNGVVDAVVLIPNSAFAGASSNTFVYLYSKFGVLNPAQGGAEQWFTRNVPPASPPSSPPPPPATASLSGAVEFDANQDPSDGYNGGIGGVAVHLDGTDSSGQTVHIDTTTDTNGLFSFNGLTAGIYTITQDPATGSNGTVYTNGLEYAGTVNGTADGTASSGQISAITLGAGQVGTNYMFTTFIRDDG